MIFLCLLCMVFLIFYIYKNLNSHSIFFLCTLNLGWILAYISFTLYLSKFNYYYSIVNQFIDFSPGTWNSLVLQNFNANTLIRLFNLGITLFYFSFLSYSISFVSSLRANKKWYYIYFILGTIGICQFLFYDPKVNLLLQNYAMDADVLLQYQKFNHTVDIVFHFVNIAYLILSFALFIFHYIKSYRLKFIRNHTLYNLISFVPLTFIHLTIFFWAPANLVRTTFSKSYVNYLQPSINLYLMEYRFFPAIAFTAIVIVIFNVYRYKSNVVRYSSINTITKKKIDTASLGIRAFTHAIKNHLLAIRSEAEYLEEKFANDEDALYSLKLIVDSCEKSFQSINEANNKLRKITLNMKAVSLNIPVEKALERFHNIKQNIKIHKDIKSDILVYIDEEQINEGIVNILKNSIEALDCKNGDIWIEIHEVDQWGMITIKDNGPGIEAENVSEIFTPFFSTKPSITNWGIGLSFCHKVITAHGGKIEVTSEIGKSTQFTILLPLVKRV